MFRHDYPIAWAFHGNTLRWPHNVQPLPEADCSEPPFKEYPASPLVPLPQPKWPSVSLHQAIARRCSCRRFSGEALPLSTLSLLLAAAYGVQGRRVEEEREFLERPVPSGGALYPLELYLLAPRVGDLACGVYHYHALSHGLEQVRAIPLPRAMLTHIFMGQDYAAGAPAILVVTAMVQRLLWKYGDRGYRYLLLEAGHLAQNINLVCSATAAGSLNLGGFFDGELAVLLGLDLDREPPLYGIAVGLPSTDDRGLQRRPG